LFCQCCFGAQIIRLAAVFFVADLDCRSIKDHFVGIGGVRAAEAVRGLCKIAWIVAIESVKALRRPATTELTRIVLRTISGTLKSILIMFNDAFSRAPAFFTILKIIVAPHTMQKIHFFLDHILAVVGVCHLFQLGSSLFLAILMFCFLKNVMYLRHCYSPNNESKEFRMMSMELISGVEQRLVCRTWNGAWQWQIQHDRPSSEQKKDMPSHAGSFS
jgi:hypothetical protein